MKSNFITMAIVIPLHFRNPGSVYDFSTFLRNHKKKTAIEFTLLRFRDVPNGTLLAPYNIGLACRCCAG